MAVRPIYGYDAGDPGESDDDPGMMVDEVIEEMDSPGDAGASGGQPPEAQVASREESEVELEQSGFYGSRKPKLLGEPYVPTEAEREEHEKTHLPWRSWCPSCVGGGAVSQPHHPAPEDPTNARLPHVLMDYFFMGQDDAKVLPMLGLKERQCKMKFAHMVEEKGPNEYAIAQVKEDIESMGIRRMIFKTDQEPAIVALRERVIEALGRKVEVIDEESPVGDHQANGEIENAIKELEKQIRILKHSTERKQQLVIQDDHPMMAWLPDYAGFLLSRFQVSKDGKTAYERLKGKAFRRELVDFAERVSFMPIVHGGKLNKFESKRELGRYV